MPLHLIRGDATIRAVKPGDTRARLSDGGGLYLLLFVKGGSHGWRFDYTFAGKRKTLSFGTYPATTLELARRKAEEARRLVREGKDPSELRKEARAELRRDQDARAREDAGLPPAGSFEAVARDWLQRIHRAKVSEAHAERTTLRLEHHVFPWIGRQPIAAIGAPELLQCIRRVEDAGTIETAHRIKQACGQVFRYGIAAGLCRRDPSADLRDALIPQRVKHHAAIVDPEGVGALLRAIDVYRGSLITRSALRLAPLTFQRPGELRKAEWQEVDLEAALWTIPAERMKGTKQRKADGGPHLVPLSVQAVKVLQELQPLTGSGRYVFPSLRTAERPMSDVAVLAALRRMGYDKTEMTGHGFRAMARTMLRERLGFEVEVIEAQLAHSVRDSLGRAYNRTEFVEQRRSMLQAWADYLDQLRKGANAPVETAGVAHA